METTLTSCNSSSLATFVPSGKKPWNVQKVTHLYRRAAFGANKATITDALTKSPSQVVDNLVDEAVAKNPTTAPPWGNWTKKQFEKTSKKIFQYRRDWQNQMAEDLFENDLRDRMTLFWSNHFVTESQSYNSPSYMFQYYNLLQLHAVGNFKDFTRDIGLSNAMLVYLNGRENTKRKPNENYARELYELFTLGVDNGYTQEDIVETSKALTGYNDRTEVWAPITFNQNKFNNDPKTIFGRTGNWGYNDVIDILFEEKPDLIANFICKKLYAYFISPDINKNIVNQLANTFKNNNFEIAPVLKRLFKSQHFFDENTYGVIVKSPADVQICFLKELDLKTEASFKIFDKVRGGNAFLGQSLLDPIDVAGWQGDLSWIGSSTLVARWDRILYYINRAFKHDKEQFRTIATNIVGTNNNDVKDVSRKLVDFFMPKALFDEDEYEEALEIFKDQVPDSYFVDGTWVLSSSSSTPTQMYRLLNYIIKIPEFQLK
ncbi:DUF1800 domain-containing protein [Aquimarina sp. ERC-38]|uniref:DUF1800 domain-containing protein n=1 Tax=Aquimarina sp. ERC-38 TaxID=2949996 RepID=UPI002247AF7E|nr:DUF1800 domain-containing protein [Aquimarina sp. ERC-38]UZO81934.1 DUF1800 domain-containing protein [Aquimarina sp. ERC-38]